MVIGLAVFFLFSQVALVEDKPSAKADNSAAQEVYDQADLRFKEALKLDKEKQPDASRKKSKQARNLLLALKSKYPNFQPELVKGRLKVVGSLLSLQNAEKAAEGMVSELAHTYSQQSRPFSNMPVLQSDDSISYSGKVSGPPANYTFSMPVITSGVISAGERKAK